MTGFHSGHFKTGDTPTMLTNTSVTVAALLGRHGYITRLIGKTRTRTMSLPAIAPPLLRQARGSLSGAKLGQESGGWTETTCSRDRQTLVSQRCRASSLSTGSLISGSAMITTRHSSSTTLKITLSTEISAHLSRSAAPNTRTVFGARISGLLTL